MFEVRDLDIRRKIKGIQLAVPVTICISVVLQ